MQISRVAAAGVAKLFNPDAAYVVVVRLAHATKRNR
jgi:hypothetical protein